MPLYTHPPGPGQLLPRLLFSPPKRWRRGGKKMKEGQEGKKIQREGRKSVGAVERRGGRRWEYVCGCFILLRGCGWRLVGGGMGPGWFSSLMSSIWLTQTQEVTRAACLVNIVLYLCDTPESRGQTHYFYYLISPPSAGHWVSPPLCISMSTSWYFWSSGASLILWLKPVQFWGWKQSHLNTFLSDSSLCFIFSFLGLLMETCWYSTQPNVPSTSDIKPSVTLEWALTNGLEIPHVNIKW